MNHNHWLVIGSNSFSGASFVDYALKQKQQVTCVSRSQEAADCFLPYHWRNNDTDRPAFHPLDLNQDAEAIVDLATQTKATHVVNFAALGMVAESWEYPLDYYNTNLLGNVKLHEGLRKIESLERYVHVSTPEVYGNTEGMVLEGTPFNPSTPYAVSRAACDLHLQSFFQNYDFPVLWTRAANVYGPGQQPYRIIPRVILCARLGLKLQLHGGGHSVRSFIHIRDVAEATLRIAQKGTPGSTYHLSTPNFVSIRELTALICEKLKVNFEDIVEEAPERAGKDHAYFLDSSKIRKELDWSDQIALEAGIEETVNWVDQWLPEIQKQPLSYQHKA